MNNWAMVALGVVLLLPVLYVLLGFIAMEALSGGMDWFFEYVIPVLILGVFAGCLVGGVWLIYAGVTT